MDDEGDFKIPTISVALVKHIDKETELDPRMDGILGLGFTAGSKSRSDPPLVHAHKMGLLNKVMFTIYLKKEGFTDKLQGGGE